MFRQNIPVHNNTTHCKKQPRLKEVSTYLYFHYYAMSRLKALVMKCSGVFLLSFDYEKQFYVMASFLKTHFRRLIIVTISFIYSFLTI